MSNPYVLSKRIKRVFRSESVIIMVVDFQEGYEYFEKNSGAIIGAYDGGYFGAKRAEYIDSIDKEISLLEKSINDFFGKQTPSKMLKGDVAEFWHAGTFNVNAAINESTHRVAVDRSHNFGSIDLSSNFKESFGLKYYGSAQESACQQAVSVFQRFKEYQAKGGIDSIEKYLADRNYSNVDAVLNDPIYSGQIRVIPHDQLAEATAWLERMINTEGARRPEQVKRYQDTLDLLRDRILDNKGNESITLSKTDAEKLAVIAKEGKFRADDFGISAPEVLSIELVMKESIKAGMSAAVISLALRVGPEIFKTIDYLIRNGEIEEGQFKKIGFAAVTGSSEGFIRGSVAAAITACCKSGLLGEVLKDVSPGVIGAVTVIAMNTLKQAYQVATGGKTRTEMSNELIKDMFVISASMAGGYVGQLILPQLPVVGYMIGSLLGSLIGSFSYNIGYKTVISFCVETGITMFGLVDQDYSLPDDIIKDIGLATFDYETFKPESFEAETFGFDTFSFGTVQPESLEIKCLRRGVIGISKIGYVG